MLKGVDILAKAVSATLGPKGRTVIIGEIHASTDAEHELLTKNRAKFRWTENHQGRCDCCESDYVERPSGESWS